MKLTTLRDFTLGVSWVAGTVILADHVPHWIVALLTVAVAAVLLGASWKELDDGR